MAIGHGLMFSSMLLLMLLGHLIPLTVLSDSSPIALISRTLDTVNNTEEDLKYVCHIKQDQGICETTYCKEIAKKLLKSMDTSVNPCDNFYDYACGSWKKYNPIPPHEVEWSEDHILTEKTYRRIIGVLAEHEKPSDIMPVRMARKFYRSCMNIVEIEKDGINPILDILNSTGGWPMIMPGNMIHIKKLSWQNIDKQYLPLLRTSAFYLLGFEVDTNNTNQYVLTINRYTEGFLSKKKELFGPYKRYFFHIFNVIQTFAKEQDYVLSRIKMTNDVGKMLQFMYKLMKISEVDKKQQESDDNYERMTIQELQKWYDDSGVTAPTAKINFLDVIQNIFKPANISINASEPIVVYNPKFLHRLARLLGQTSQRVLVNYVQWNFVNTFLTYTTEEMKDEDFKMRFSSYDISRSAPRWVECVRDMKMGHAISYMFVRKYISDNVINKTREMVENIRMELGRRIMDADWISEADKKNMTQKLNTIESQIGYPNWYKDKQALIEYYKGLEISSNYFQNILNIERNEFLRILKRFGKPVERNEWTTYPVTVNAFADQQKNVINIPAAELQDPFLTPHLPHSINYGNIGFTIGHELSHNFDNEGIRLDANGSETAWISQELLYKYEKKLTCVVNQYSNYTLNIKGKHGQLIKLDGRLTESENIADLIGIQIAFSAYKKVAEQEPQMKLPKLESMSDEKLFFLMFANSWCSSARRKYALRTANIDEHSPPMYRVIGSLSNDPEFSEIFKCPRNSYMNPQNNCNLWN